MAILPDEQERDQPVPLPRDRQLANERYLEALSVIEDPAPAYRQVEKLTEPVVKAGRSYAGFNPASRSDVKLFESVLDRQPSWCVASATPTSEKVTVAPGTIVDDPVERRRQSASVGRLLKRLRLRTDSKGASVVAVVARQSEGHRLLQGVVQLYHCEAFRPLLVQPRSSVRRCAHRAEKAPR